MPLRRHVLAAGFCAAFGASLATRLGPGAAHAGVAGGKQALREESLVEEPVVEDAWSRDGLAGTLARPRGGGQGLGVLIIAGSGPTDRDGNGPGLSTNLYRQMALGLAASGHVVLRYDKRGVAASRGLMGREEDLTFPVLEDDACVALLALRDRSDVRAVVPLGHSEGALMAIRLARREQVAGLMLMAAPGRPFADILAEQIAASGLSPQLVAEAGEILAALRRGERVARVPAALASLFRPSVQPYLISEMAIDPAAELSAVRVPALILGGGRDIQVGEKDLQRLARARPEAQVVRLAEANHIFKSAPQDRAGNVALYADPAAPLHPGVLPALYAFLAGLRESAVRSD